jgi:hypothetical protein
METAGMSGEHLSVTTSLSIHFWRWVHLVNTTHFHHRIIYTKNTAAFAAVFFDSTTTYKIS